jgi:hypothetical protein
MEILNAYDLTGSYRAAAELCGCSHHTVKKAVQERDAGLPSASRRARMIDDWRGVLEGWVVDSKGKIRGDKVHQRLLTLGYTGTDRTTRRALAEVKSQWRLGNTRVHRPWITEPGLWLQYDFGDGPIVEGRKVVLLVAWLAWCRYRVVVPLRDRTAPSVFAGLDRIFRILGGAPTYLLTDNEKTVTTGHIAGVPVRNRQAVTFGRYYGISGLTCQPADPASKGGVENAVKLIEARHGKIPPVRTAYGDIGGVIAIRIDATLINSYSDKDCATGNFKGGYGFHPLTAWCDNTGECLAIIARTGSAGSTTAADHIAIIDAAIAAIPAKHRRRLLITIDGAGSTHRVLDHITALDARDGFSVEYSLGYNLDAQVRNAIALLPEDVWEPALDSRGAARDDAAIAEVTGLLRKGPSGDKLTTWPARMRILVRREPIDEGTQLSLFEQTNGYRYQPFATATTTGQLQRLEAVTESTPAWKGSFAARKTRAWPSSRRPRST